MWLDGEEAALRDAGLLPDAWTGQRIEYELKGRRCKADKYTKRLVRVTIYRHASEKETTTRVTSARRCSYRPEPTEYVAPTPEGVLRRLGAVHGLVMFAEAFVSVRVGNSNKLARALEDITAARTALGEIRNDLCKLLGNEDAGVVHAFLAKRTADQIAAWGRRGH